MEQVKVYGADWCHDTQATRRTLDRLGVPYDYHDIDTDPAALDWVKARNGGKRKLPTLDVGGQILSVPDDRELEQTLRETGVTS